MDSLPTVSKSPEDFWESDNLWRCCVRVDGKYTIGRYKAMELLRGHDFEGPIGDLARPIIETAFRLNYLSDDDERLTDYARWQLLDYYHRILGRVAQFGEISAEFRKNCDHEMNEIRTILGHRFTDRPPRATWKPFDQLITFENGTEDQNRLRAQLYTATGVALSRALHNAWLSPFSAQYNADAGTMGFVLAMDRIGKICLDKHLVGTQGAQHAKRIVELCDSDNWGG